MNKKKVLFIVPEYTGHGSGHMIRSYRLSRLLFYRNIDCEIIKYGIQVKQVNPQNFFAVILDNRDSAFDKNFLDSKNNSLEF